MEGWVGVVAAACVRGLAEALLARSRQQKQ